MKNQTEEIYFQGLDVICEYDRVDGELLGAEIKTGPNTQTDWFFESLIEFKREQLEEAFYKHMKGIQAKEELEQSISNREAAA